MTMKYTIKHRHTGEAIFAVDIGATDATPKPLRLRMAVIAACAARADLTRADLAGADLTRADLAGVGLIGVCGVNGFIKALHLEEWPVSYTATVMQIGCERHPIEDWRSFDNARIVKMDGKRALNFWRKNKALIFQAIDTCPARPTGAESA